MALHVWCCKHDKNFQSQITTKEEGWDLENSEMGWVLGQYSHTKKGF